METIGILFVVISAAMGALALIRRDPRVDRRFVLKSLLGIGLFAGYCAIGVLMLLAALRSTNHAVSDARALAAVVFVLAWYGYGMLLLIRNIPRLREPPAFFMRVGPLDVWLICIAGAAIIYLTL